MKFVLDSPYQPEGDQPQAIKALAKGLKSGLKDQVLLGATGTGKTFTMANLVAQLQRPTLVLVHNKTLAAQLYGEFKSFFPKNAVHYFVSYFDYYQPEAYVPASDTYIEKDSDINEEIDRLRHGATASLLSRRDVLIVASVSCIYGLGSVENYSDLSEKLKLADRCLMDKLIRRLIEMQYLRNDLSLTRGNFRVRGDVLDIYPAGEETAYRLEFFGDTLERIVQINPLTGEIEAELKALEIFPSSHFVTPADKLKTAIQQIKVELKQRSQYFKDAGKLLEDQRLNQRAKFDLEMMEQTGFVKGIENYSLYLTGRQPGEQPTTLLDYFPDDFLLLIDESHMSLPQVRGMYNGDQARKQTLVDYGFRLPSALDNRPLKFQEFQTQVNQVVYVSATPADYELKRSPKPIEQIIRPTGLLDPEVEVRAPEGQIDDLLAEIKLRISKKQRVLVTTLTKRMAEDLSEHLQELEIKVNYLHSEIDTLERSDILRDLRLGVYDVLVGINLLREGLDLPEVSLVAILDADKEGFLRSEQALIQTIGRAARHQEGKVIMYAASQTASMKRAIKETSRRRQIQAAHNRKHKITPKSIESAVKTSLATDKSLAAKKEARKLQKTLRSIPKEELPALIKQLNAQMHLHAANLEFEQAAELRDQLKQLHAD